MYITFSDLIQFTCVITSVVATTIAAISLVEDLINKKK